MYNGKIRKIKIEEREGCLIFIKTILRKSQIKIGDWIILKAKNLVNNKEIIFPANVRSNYRINIRKSIRSKLDLKFDFKTPVEFEIIKKLVRINLENKKILGISNNLIKILPSSLRINNQIIKLNCFEWQHNKLLFSYKNSKSSNYITLNKTFFFDPFIIGLWRAEGGKYSLTRSSLQLTNSNPIIIKKWLSFINSLGFSNNDPKLFYYIQYVSAKRDLKREESLLRFWSKHLNLSKDKLGFIYKQGLGYKSKFYGTLLVKFNNSTLSFILQYLFLKFENSLLSVEWSKNVAINYLKGTLCDCDCELRNNRLHQIKFSTSSKEEGTLIRNILYKYMGIVSRGQQDPRNKCYYIRITHYDNYLKFAKYEIFKGIPWRGNNTNYYKFVKGFSLHKSSLDILENKDEENNSLVNRLRSMYLQSMPQGNASALQSKSQSQHPKPAIGV